MIIFLHKNDAAGAGLSEGGTTEKTLTYRIICKSEATDPGIEYGNSWDLDLDDFAPATIPRLQDTFTLRLKLGSATAASSSSA
jgi:hypothetical protein